MILAHFTIGETFKIGDIIFIIFSFFGVTLTTLGIKENKKKAVLTNDKGFENIKTIAFVALILAPLLSAWANVTNSKMKGLHR